MSTTTSPVSPVLRANLICMLSMLIWAAALPAADLIIPLLSPEHLNAMRMGLAAMTLLPFWLMIEGWQSLARVSWTRGIAVGCLIGLGAWFLVLGQARTGSVTMAVISATMPVIGIALEVVLDGRRLSWAVTLGVLLSLVGGLLSLDFAAGGMTFGIGALFCFASVFFFTIGSRFTVTAFPQESPLARTAVTLTGAAIAAISVVLVQSALGAPGPDFGRWGLPQTGALLLFSVGAVGIAQLLWISSVGRLGIGMTALHMNAAPFYVMLILFAAGGRWDWADAAAAALVGLGVLVAQGLVKVGRRQ
jgi:drug/metabolite transporter (DMT)-like permease